MTSYSKNDSSTIHLTATFGVKVKVNKPIHAMATETLSEVDIYDEIRKIGSELDSIAVDISLDRKSSVEANEKAKEKIKTGRLSLRF